MDNNETKTIFDKILSNNIFPYLKKLNFKKKGNNFRFYNKAENFGVIINFQKSQWNQHDKITFVINVSVYIPEYEYYLYDVPKISNENFTEPMCAIRNRFSDWFELNKETDINILIKDLENDIVKRIIPFLNEYMDKKYIFEQLFRESYFGNYELARIKTLYKNGYRDEMENIIKSENYQRKYKGILLEKIDKWLKGNE